MSDFPITSTTGQELFKQLPSYYQDIREARVISEAEGLKLDQLQASMKAILNQFFVETATWGLDRWESEFGIIPQAGQPYDQRRAVIRSRIRGTGTVTVELMRRVAAAYDNGDIDVTQQPALYQITIKFASTLGLPPNIDDLKAAIEKIKPAHLTAVYSFRYLTISEIESMTISQIESTTLDRFAGGGV